jgi:hypothetical protein
MKTARHSIAILSERSRLTAIWIGDRPAISFSCSASGSRAASGAAISNGVSDMSPLSGRCCAADEFCCQVVRWSSPCEPPPHVRSRRASESVTRDTGRHPNRDIRRTADDVEHRGGNGLIPARHQGVTPQILPERARDPMSTELRVVPPSDLRLSSIRPRATGPSPVRRPLRPPCAAPA